MTEKKAKVIKGVTAGVVAISAIIAITAITSKFVARRRKDEEHNDSTSEEAPDWFYSKLKASGSLKEPAKEQE